MYVLRVHNLIPGTDIRTACLRVKNGVELFPTIELIAVSLESASYS